jgi:hypothetical protein
METEKRTLQMLELVLARQEAAVARQEKAEANDIYIYMHNSDH